MVPNRLWVVGNNRVRMILLFLSQCFVPWKMTFVQVANDHLITRISRVFTFDVNAINPQYNTQKSDSFSVDVQWYIRLWGKCYECCRHLSLRHCGWSAAHSFSGNFTFYHPSKSVKHGQQQELKYQSSFPNIGDGLLSYVAVQRAVNQFRFVLNN